jgi:hypothetical protein
VHQFASLTDAKTKIEAWIVRSTYDDRGWRATFHTTGIEHSPTNATGTGYELTPWRAVQSGGPPLTLRRTCAQRKSKSPVAVQ